MLYGKKAERNRSIAGVPAHCFILSETNLRKPIDSTNKTAVCGKKPDGVIGRKKGWLVKTTLLHYSAVFLRFRLSFVASKLMFTRNRTTSSRASGSLADEFHLDPRLTFFGSLVNAEHHRLDRNRAHDIVFLAAVQFFNRYLCHVCYLLGFC